MRFGLAAISAVAHLLQKGGVFGNNTVTDTQFRDFKRVRLSDIHGGFFHAKHTGALKVRRAARKRRNKLRRGQWPWHALSFGRRCGF